MAEVIDWGRRELGRASVKAVEQRVSMQIRWILGIGDAVAVLGPGIGVAMVEVLGDGEMDEVRDAATQCRPSVLNPEVVVSFCTRA
jgi:hypothetical protein